VTGFCSVGFPVLFAPRRTIRRHIRVIARGPGGRAGVLADNCRWPAHYEILPPGLSNGSRATGCCSHAASLGAAGVDVMMTLHKLHAGDGYTYLTRQVAAGDEGRSPGQELADYYTASGNPPGR